VEPDRRSAFRSLYERHAGSVFAYALRRSSPTEAQDVVSETFLVAWRRYDDMPEDSLPWLLGVARRVLANTGRSAHRRASLVVRLQAPSGSIPAGDPAEEVQAKLAILAALDTLTPNEREAITLVAWDGLDTARAATAAGCSRAAFSVRLHRARRRLVKELHTSGHLVNEGETTPAPGYEEAEL
jgi:RNA polymerase sigma-70 factor (ECF subfamily)